MFTGLISEVGTVAHIELRGGTSRISVKAPKNASLVSIGNSVAVNGVCLTATSIVSDVIEFDVSTETLRISALGSLINGGHVNLELALKTGDRLDGHFVLGHVDCVGEVRSIVKPVAGRDGALEISVPEETNLYLVDKGSIAINGVSLTIRSILNNVFGVTLVPHTWRCTNFGVQKPGSHVNVEFDLLIKAVMRSLKGIVTKDSRISFDKLSEWGY